jgi:hypothetical protein
VIWGSRPRHGASQRSRLRWGGRFYLLLFDSILTQVERGEGKGEMISLPGDVSMLRRVFETMAAFLSTTNSKPSVLMSLTKPAVSSSSPSRSTGGGGAPPPALPCPPVVDMSWICLLLRRGDVPAAWADLRWWRSSCGASGGVDGQWPWC